MYYRQSDTPQTGVISSEGYTRVPDITTLQYDIIGLTPFTHYAVHVQAVVMGQFPLVGDVLLEIVRQTPPGNDIIIVTILMRKFHCLVIMKHDNILVFSIIMKKNENYE